MVGMDINNTMIIVPVIKFVIIVSSQLPPISINATYRKAEKSLCMHEDRSMLSFCTHSYIVTCDLPTQLLNHSVIVDAGSQEIPPIEGQLITYTCSTGFILTGPNTSVCMGNREWEPDPGEVECIGAVHNNNINGYQ